MKVEGDILLYGENIVAYRPVAGQIPQNGRVQTLLRNRRINKYMFLSNGLGNMFL
jgi:hypothetical protein